jgi:hypothetical protein
LNQLLINEIMEGIREKDVFTVPWDYILTTYQQANEELGNSPALAAVFELGKRLGDAIAWREVQDMMKERPEAFDLCMKVAKGISPEVMEELVPAMRAEGINDELIEAIKLFETKSDH